MSCGSNDPGFNCMWQKSFTECGPCASHTTCPSCSEPYSEGDLIIQCVQCERFVLLHIHRDPLPYTLCFTYEYKSASLSEFYYGKTRFESQGGHWQPPSSCFFAVYPFLLETALITCKFNNFHIPTMKNIFIFVFFQN